MTAWSAQELDSLDKTEEIRIAGRREDGSLRTLVIVWHVVVDGAVYARSVKGTEGRWYQGVVERFEGAISWAGQTRDVTYALDDSHDAAIDAAYLVKYGTGPDTQAIINEIATPTTLRIDPS